MRKIDHYNKKLSEEKSSNFTTSFYHGNSLKSKIRRENLKLYLYKMVDLKPIIFDVRRSTRLQSCSLTGIPFSSERVLTKNSLIRNQNYYCINEDQNIETEA